MTDKKKNTHHHEWKSNRQDDNQAQPNGVVPIIIQNKNKRAKGNTDHHKDDAADKFPFPGNNKKSK